MAEFAVAVSVLTMLLLGMPIISSYHELEVMTFEGARRLAFQSSWRQAGLARPSAEALASELFPPTANADRPTAAHIEADFSVGSTPGRAGQAGRILLTPFATLERLGSGFDLRDDALHRAELRVELSRPAGMPEPFAQIPIELTGTYVLLGDAWASSGPDQVARRTGGLTLAHGAQTLRPLTNLGTALLSVIEPAFRQFCPGIVDPERVPGDRLTFGAEPDTTPVSRWVPAC